MSIQVKHIKEANKFFKKGDYLTALDHYEKASDFYRVNGPKTLFESLQFNTKVCTIRHKESHLKRSFKVTRGQNDIFLLVNPSHAHKTEIQFWNEFVENALYYNYLVVDLNFRKVNAFKGASTFVHPARLADLSKKLSVFIDKPLPSWANMDLVDLYADWEHRRWQIEKYSSNVRTGCICLISYIDYVINKLKPAIVLTTNKIDPPNHFAFLASKYYGIEYRFIERSPLNSHLVESNGMFQEANFCEDVVSQLLGFVQSNTQPRISSDEIASSILRNPYGFRDNEAVKELLVNLSEISHPLFFLPLDNLLWTGWAQNDHPQGNIDYAIFRDVEHTLRTINNIVVHQFGGTLLIKPHPSCREWMRLRDCLPQLNFTESDLDTLCDASDVILSFLTKVSYLGLSKCKPVVSFGSGLLDHLGVTFQVKSPNNLIEVLNQAARGKGLKEKLRKFNNLLPYLSQRFFSKGSLVVDDFIRKMDKSVERPNKNTTELISATLDRSFQQKNSNLMLHINCRTFSPCEKPLIIFDVSRLLSARLLYSGVSRYVKSVARQLLLNKKLNVVLGYFPQKNPWGASAYHFNQLRKSLSENIVFLEDAFNYADSLGKQYIYHSPINPLPAFGQHINMRRVITIHDVLHITLPDYYHAENYITPNIIESIDLKRDGVVFVSDYSMKDFEKLTGEAPYKKTVTHLAPDLSFQKPDFFWLEKNFKDLTFFDYIIFPCQCDHRKGFNRMFRISMAWLNASPLQRRVVVFGSEPNKKWYDSLLSQCDREIQSRFFYFSKLPDERLAALYNRSRALLYLSEAEGFGLPPLEAMYSGCPPVMLDNTSLREVYKDWRLLLKNNATDAEVLDSLEKLSADNVYYSLMCSKAQKYASRFSGLNSANLLIELYFEILGIQEPELKTEQLNFD